MLKIEEMRKLAVDSVNGQQTKGCVSGKWYKLDKHGYESAAEALCADMNYAFGVPEYVEYRECSISQNDIPMAACVSDDFSLPGYKIVTLEELAAFKGMREKLNNLAGTEPVQFMADFLEIAEEIVGKPDVKDYILDQLWLDCLYYNIDRHINNFSFYLGKDVRFVPYYDFGAALFSDMRIFKGVENEATARVYMERWPMNPLQFPLKEMVAALRHFKEFPYDLKQLDDVQIASRQDWIIPRVKMCLKLTKELIEK